MAFSDFFFIDIWNVCNAGASIGRPNVKDHRGFNLYDFLLTDDRRSPLLFVTSKIAQSEGSLV